MRSDDDLSAFIRASFRSIWSLEVLLLLKSSERPWTEHDLVGAMRASQLIVSESLHRLAAAGLIYHDDQGNAAYGPVTQSIARSVDAVEALYARAPDSVRRLIVSSSAAGLTAFADAFRLRGD